MGAGVVKERARQLIASSQRRHCHHRHPPRKRRMTVVAQGRVRQSVRARAGARSFTRGSSRGTGIGPPIKSEDDDGGGGQGVLRRRGLAYGGVTGSDTRRVPCAVCCVRGRVLSFDRAGVRRVRGWWVRVAIPALACCHPRVVAVPTAPRRRVLRVGRWRGTSGRVRGPARARWPRGSGRRARGPSGPQARPSPPAHRRGRRRG